MDANSCDICACTYISTPMLYDGFNIPYKKLKGETPSQQLLQLERTTSDVDREVP